MKRSLSASLGAAALLSACSVGPNFKTPASPTEYPVEAEALSSERHIALGKQIEAEWWTLFASQPLDELIKQAMADNYDIAAAKETLLETEEAVKAARGGLYPSASLEAIAGRQKYGAALFGPLNFSIPPFTYYEVGPSLSWTPDLFGGAHRKIERRQALADYQAHQLDAAYVALSGNVVAQALNVAATREEIAAVDQIIAEDEKTLKLVQAAFQAGSNTRGDILAAQSQLDGDKALLPDLRQRLSVAQHALFTLMGKRPAGWTMPEFSLSSFTLPRELPVSLPSEMVRRRPDILASEANLHAASAAIGIATANLYPNINLTANLLQEALAPRGLFEASSAAWGVAGGLTAPIFSGGKLAAEKREAAHAYQAALAQYQQIILRAFGQVADALTGLMHNSEAIAAQEQALNTAGDSLSLARKSYQAGNIGLLQIQEAQRQLARAQLGLIRAQSQRYMNIAELFVALGGSPVARP